MLGELLRHVLVVPRICLSLMTKQNRLHVLFCVLHVLWNTLYGHRMLIVQWQGHIHTDWLLPLWFCSRLQGRIRLYLRSSVQMTRGHTFTVPRSEAKLDLLSLYLVPWSVPRSGCQSRAGFTNIYAVIWCGFVRKFSLKVCLWIIIVYTHYWTVSGSHRFLLTFSWIGDQ